MTPFLALLVVQHHNDQTPYPQASKVDARRHVGHISVQNSLGSNRLIAHAVSTTEGSGSHRR